MRLPLMSTTRGVIYLLRGLRRGRLSTTMAGTFMILSRLVMRKRRRGGRPVTVHLAPGESVGLRVSRPGDDPVDIRLR